MEKSLTALLIFIALIFMQLIESGYGGTSDYSNASCFKSERDALLKFKESLNGDTSRLSSWIGEDCCSWKGVGCDQITSHVVKLDLSNPTCYDYSITCLRGKINPSIVKLKHLQYLDLSMNDFSGSQIPEFLGSFEILRYLNLSWAHFEGKVPHYLGNLSSLQFLDLHSFIFELIDDDLWWVSKLHSLKYLDLSGVNLTLAAGTDWLHAINTLPSLSILSLADCELHTIPNLAHVNFTSLTSLDIGVNGIHALPEWLFNLSSLVQLRLNGNPLNSSVLDSIARLSSLTALSLSDIYLNYSFSSSLCQLHNLVELDLSANRFRGSFPGCIRNLTSLTVLDLSHNAFQGSIPSEVGNLSHLQVLNLSYNKFEHEIPMSMGNLCNLRALDLSVNSFKGGLSNIMGNTNSSLSGCLKDLESLRLSSNSLFGPIPASLGGLSSLRELRLDSNHLNGSIPSSLGELSKLETLGISDNSLVGVISEGFFANLTRLKFLYASTNSFIILSVSAEWTPPFQLHSIHMGSWKVGPRFPLWLRTQSHVLRLNMSNANISDTIPHWFDDLSSKMELLDLSYNNISGILPKFLASDTGIMILKSNKFEGPLSLPSYFRLLDLSNNLLSGYIPPIYHESGPFLAVLILSKNNLSGDIEMICNLTNLGAIDLSDNNFSGNLPPCFQNLGHLEVLDLTNNSFYGQIPTSFGSLENLKSLHVHNNKFHGKLPPSLQNLRHLIILDVCRNGFDGTIPSWIGEKLSRLKVLSLHSNKFTGDIPSNICNLTSLQVLNLAKNGITGNIPPCFGNLTAMIEVISYGSLLKYDFAEVINAYEDGIIASINGIERLYTRTSPFLVWMDLSNNNMVGEVPKELMNLVGLIAVNLSHNHFCGTIPANIGNLTLLESLDLSINKLSGPIPQSLSLLHSLSHLNLSFNNLSGHIPTGYQLQTLDDPSIYIGNNFLCGKPLKPFPSDKQPLDGQGQDKGGIESESGDNDDSYSSWFYAGIGPGFATGFIGVCVVLYFDKSWRHAYFSFVENVYHKLYVAIAVKLNWLHRKLGQR